MSRPVPEFLQAKTKLESATLKFQRHMSMKKAILTLALVLCVKAYGACELSCPLHSLSSDGLPSPAPVSFDQFTFNIEPESSNAVVRITNRGTRPINASFMVVDFYVSGHYLLSMVFYSTTSAEETSFKPAARISSTFFAPAPFSSSLLPGESYRDSAESAVRPLACPDKARIVVLQIAFAGRKSLDHRSPGWRVDPSLLHVDSWSSNGFPTKPVSVSSRVSVNELGRVRVLAMSTVDSPESDDSELSSWLTDQIEDRFTYVPAQYDGAAISYEMDLVIRFYPAKGSDPINNLPRDSAKLGVTVVDLVSAAPGKAYGLVYAGYPLFGEILRPPKSP